MQPLGDPPTLRVDAPYDLDYEGLAVELHDVAAQVAGLRPWSETDSGWAFKPPR